MLRFDGLTAAQREQATDLIVALIGANALELEIAITRSPTGLWRVHVQRPPGDGPSLLPELAREEAYADLAEVLTLALSRALN